MGYRRSAIYIANPIRYIRKDVENQPSPERRKMAKTYTFATAIWKQLSRWIHGKYMCWSSNDELELSWQPSISVEPQRKKDYVSGWYIILSYYLLPLKQ